MRLRKLLLTVLLTPLLVCAEGGQVRAVNGASFADAQPLAPGSFASLFGENLCGATLTATYGPNGELPTSLGGTTVTVNGTAAMIYYVSPTQINFVMPASLPSGQARISVQYGNSVFDTTVLVGAAGPGIFATNGMGMGDGAVLHAWLWLGGPFSVTTDGQPTQLALFLTGIDETVPPKVMVGGVEVEVKYYGPAPGYLGLQQINFVVPAGFAGVGRVPVTVESDGVISNVTYISILPTTTIMERYVPGWMPGQIVRENMRLGRDVNAMAFIPATNTALVADAEQNVVQVIPIASNSLPAAIPLPDGAQPLGIAANAAGTIAAVALTSKASVAFLNLDKNQVTSVVSTGFLPGAMAFHGTDLLVTNTGSGSVSVIDSTTGQITDTIEVGFGPTSIAIAGELAIVTNTQSGSLSLIDLTTHQVTTVMLRPGARPRDVAISADGSKAVITTPTANAFFLLDVATRNVTVVETAAWGCMGPAGVAIRGSTAYIANQMTASVSVFDLATAKLVRTFPVDPGPRDLVVNAAKNQLIVLCAGTGTLDVVDLGTFSIVSRIDAGLAAHVITWPLPTVTGISPNRGAIGSTFTFTVSGMNLEDVTDLKFDFVRLRRLAMEDTDIKVTNVVAKADGSAVTATVQILAGAAEGQRLLRLVSSRGELRAPFAMALFTVAKQ